VILFDGHEPLVSQPLARAAKEKGILTILDAGSVHQGTVELSPLVDYLVCSQKFASDFTGDSDESLALTSLTSYAQNVIVTLGERGLIWQNPSGRSFLPAFKVEAVDTTGAGDTFHGALAACVAIDLPWLESLEIASAAAAICCSKMGARPGIPTMAEVRSFLALNKRM
jgi:sulfofructose kinase